jgi:hypothetical protein
VNADRTYYTVRTSQDGPRIQRKPLKLPFNGELSTDEQRMLDQFAFEEYEAAA